MRQNQIKNLTHLDERRKELRNNLTSAEAVLWISLKGSALAGRKFRRQHSIGSYLVDFYCPAEKLVVELDGGVHDDPIQSDYDARRTEWLKKMGNRVIRFQNKVVFQDMVSVLAEIERNFGWSVLRE